MAKSSKMSGMWQSDRCLWCQLWIRTWWIKSSM